VAGDSKRLQPIIIKRIKRTAVNRHAGSWKIAYADFVTAMMAFFLLMWLMGTTSEGDRKGIADFFSTPLKVSFNGGPGSADEASVIQGGGEDMSRSRGQVKKTEVETKRRAINLVALKTEQRGAEKRQLETLKQRVQDLVIADPRLAALQSQVKLDLTPEGLRIQLIDEQNRPLFDNGSALVKPYMRDLLRVIGDTLTSMPNRLSIEGHTDATAFGGGERGYSNWELSADRANASRRELLSGGLPDARVLRVQGLASSQPLHRADPNNPNNRRISIMVMNRDAEDQFFSNSALPASAPGR
jgi:chemotaxis protein MotB